MKVYQLIGELLRQDMNREVILSKDVEGNQFRYLDEVSTGSFEPAPHKWEAYQMSGGEANCVVLIPVN